MSRRARRPSFSPDLVPDFLEALRRARDYCLQYSSAEAFGSEGYERAHAVTEAIDGMAEKLTGDRTHFHIPFRQYPSI